MEANLPNALIPHYPTQNRCALLLEMLCSLRIIPRKTAAHFCWKCFVPFSHYPAQNRYALLLEMLCSFSHYPTQNRYALLLEMLAAQKQNFVVRRLFEVAI